MPACRYISTRGGTAPLGFEETVLNGLARDSGLFLPASIPDVRHSLSSWKKLSYRQLAFEIMRLYTDIPEEELKDLIQRSYAAFRHPEVAPVIPLDGLFILELFHGPTLAFKDIALQFLGNLFEYFLSKSGKPLNILAATSGDTGSAAIYGIKGRERMRIFVLYPHGKITPLQERQMTTVQDENVFNLAIEGSFDDCQRIVKEIFADLPFKDRYALGAVNSINWARLLAQIVYFFYAAFRVMERTGRERVRFAVPTGNFGDVFAGYLAYRMGLPIGLLVMATNENDILTRFFNTGKYQCHAVQATISPSMDIQVASNLERYLYYHLNCNPQLLCKLMQQFAGTGRLEVACPADGKVDPVFASGSANTATTLATIREWHANCGYLFDPHSAVGVHVAQSFLDAREPMICLATAHPAKFKAAIKTATGRDLARHEFMDGLDGMEMRRSILPASSSKIREFIREKSVL